MVDSFFQNDKEIEKFDRATALAMFAAQMAFEEAWVDRTSTEGLRQGVLVGTACGPVHSVEELYGELYREKSPLVKPLSAQRTMPHSMATAIATRHSIDGSAAVVSAGGASSLAALFAALQALRLETTDIMLVGGVDCPLVPEHFRMWDAQRVLTREFNTQPAKASRPFAADRSGLVLAEGSGAVVMEREKTAEARKANIYAEVLGVGQSYSQDHSAAARVDSQAACMTRALDNAGLAKGEIEHIQASAVSSPPGDVAEAEAIRKVFGGRTDKIAVSSVKSMIGHALGASGILSLIAALVGMRENFIPPTINLDEPDPECNLDHVANEARDQEIHNVLVNSFEPDGINVSVVVRKI